MNDFDPNYQPIIINFRVGQKVVIFNPKNEILFLKRSDQTDRAGGWDFPGGGLEYETPEEGIIRETLEEAGISITHLQLVSTITFDRDEQNTKTLLLGYFAHTNNSKIKLSWEHTEHKWVSIKKSLELDLPAAHKKFLVAAIAHFKLLNLKK